MRYEPANGVIGWNTTTLEWDFFCILNFGVQDSTSSHGSILDTGGFDSTLDTNSNFFYQSLSE